MAKAKNKSLVFPNEDTLRVALTSGMIPPDAQAAGVSFWQTDGGELGVLPSEPLPADALKTLASAGVVFAKAPKTAEEALCWAALLRPVHVGEAHLATDHVMFLLDGERSLLELSAELLRLGCDRQSYQFVANGSTKALLRASDPPYFTVASALDETTGYRAFAPVRHGQEVVWAEIGYEHPLGPHIMAPSGEVVLIGADGKWTTFENGPWSDIYQLIDFRLPGDTSEHNQIEPPRRLEVPLKLANATRVESPSLWVIRNDAVNVVDRLVQTLPDDIIARLLFAVGGNEDDPVVILRARMGRSGPPQIDIAGESYVPLLQITNLYVPLDAIIEPPLRRDKLRELLAPTEDEIAWLAPDEEDRGFHVESIDDSTFAPLSAWVDYLVHSEAIRLEPWIRSTTFDFDAFQSVGTEWAEGPPKPKERPKERRPRERNSNQSRERGSREELRRSTRRRRNENQQHQRVEVDLTGDVEEHVATPDEEELAALEAEFLEIEAPADDPVRTNMWIDMAQLNTRLGRLRDTGLCWTRALWELGGDEALETAELWVEGEGIGTEESADMLHDILEMAEPSRNEVRSIVADLIYTDMAGDNVSERFGDIAELQSWLDKHDDVLDVRSIWLARLALARQTGGDRLAATRTRDRLLRRLATGLSLEKDVPTFLRFVGGGSTGEGSAVGRLVEQLQTFQQAFEKTKRKRSAVEAPEELTGAYVGFVFAYGYARLGQSETARTLRDRSMGALDTNDTIHGFLARAYSARIDQALEARPSGTPLPTEISGELNNLEKFHRYKVDRLRQASNILEPHERLDPVRAFQRGEKDPRGEEFAELRGMTDTEELAGRIDGLMTKALEAAPEERDRLFDGTMDFFPQLPSRAVPHLQTILGNIGDIAPARRAMILEEALILAGFFGRGELVRETATTLQGLIAELKPDEAVEVAGEFGHALRSLRRVGLRAEAADLLDTMNKSVTGDGVQPLVARLHMAAGLAYLGDTKRADPILKGALNTLVNDPLTTPDRLKLVRGTAVAWSQYPQDNAIHGLRQLGDQLAHISDSYNTNSHFCLSVIEFVESIVLGYASEDLAMGELGRRWLDEDEYLVRRRIHRDLGAL